MKKLLFVSILLTLAGCNTPNDVEIEEINAKRDVDIAKEKTQQSEELTKQLELELKIVKEQSK